MKKRVKKLGLHRETLRHLQDPSLERIVGGGTTTSQACDQATYCECESQGPACTLPPSACLASCSC
jgi:hypothetical protein